MVVAGCVSSRPRTIESLDSHWRFLRSDSPGAESASFDDSQWRVLDVPHDWSIEGPRDPKEPAGAAGGFFPTGIGWYRKHFTLPAAEQGRRAFVEFDGVMANSDVWINGHHLGHRPYGYVSFEYEISDFLHFGGQENVLAVRADNSLQPASRWYAGAGIYRHVRMILVDPLYIQTWSTFVTTPIVDASGAVVRVRSTIVNAGVEPHSARLRVELLDPRGEKAGNAESAEQTIPPDASCDFTVDITVPSPQLWDTEHPNLYQAVSGIDIRRQIIDDKKTTFGIRQIEFKPDTGFWLNGKNLKLKGVCLHNDMGGLGTAVPLGTWVDRLMALKRLGCNAIRTAHNPPSPEFLDLCDRMGFLVMDEMFDCWTIGKNPYDYSRYFRAWALTDLRDAVRRDRNHPSIILYSAGNEIRDTRNAAAAKKTLSSLVDAFHETDPTRPVTQALLRPNVTHDYTDGLADLLDVVGTNYRESELLAAHEAVPARKIVGTEDSRELRSWLAMRDNPPFSGEFIWAGADYLGEGNKWPQLGKENGLLDIINEPRPIAFQLQSWWTASPMVYMARDGGLVPTGNPPGEQQTRPVQYPDWTPANLRPHRETILVFSNCQSVELILNGKSLGSKDRPTDDSPRSWTLQFVPGTLIALAPTAAASSRTTGCKPRANPPASS